ncbi:MAG: hypothetical protein RLZZ81_926 [Pseudomonadota bacterium]|jgi:hypothetical protein
MRIKFSILPQFPPTLFTEEESNKILPSSANNLIDNSINNIDQNTKNIPSETDLTGHDSTHDLVLLALY